MLALLFKILIFIVVFSLLILIHELGHFYFAKRAGVKVEEFGLGMPPRLFGKKYGETLYTINWIPFGGFVRLYGEDATDPDILKSSRSFASKTPWQQVQIICGGVLMNFLLAFLLLSFGFWYGIEPLYASPEEQLNGIRDGQIELEHGIYFSQTGSQLFPTSEDIQVLFDESRNPVQVPFLVDGKIVPYTISSAF